MREVGGGGKREKREERYAKTDTAGGGRWERWRGGWRKTLTEVIKV